MLTEDYRVRLELFQGPLDLLLFLIRKSEVDINDIPVAAITDQYMAFLGQLDRVDIDVAGEFLVMAATLMEIKSRMIAGIGREKGGDAGAETDSTDPRADLVRQLLAFKQYRDASRSLQSRWEEWRKRYPAAAMHEAVESDAPAPLDLEDLEVIDLMQAFERVMAGINLDRLGDHQIVDDDTPIEVHAQDILERLGGKSQNELAFSSLFTGRTRPEMIGLFLALLDLVRHRRVSLRQEATPAGREIYLQPAPQDEATPPASI